MTHRFDLGMSRPPALAIAPPLADGLERLCAKKVNRRCARSTTLSILLVAAFFIAPLSIAEAHPKNSLEDTIVTSNSGKSVIKIHKLDGDGHDVKKHFEIELNGDEYEAYEFDENGRKTKVDISEIEGFDTDIAAEIAKGAKSWKFAIGDNDSIKFEDDTVMRVEESKDGQSTRVFSWRGTPPEPPMPPEEGYAHEVERVFVVQSETMRAEAQLSAAKSMLESVEDMLENIEETKETKKDLKAVRRDLEKARKSLKATERRLEEKSAAE